MVFKRIVSKKIYWTNDKQVAKDKYGNELILINHSLSCYEMKDIKI